MPLPKRSTTVEVVKDPPREPKIPRAQITGRLVEAVIRAIEIGNYPHQAAALAGVTRAEFDKWLRAGRAWIENPDAVQNPDFEHLRLCAELCRGVDEACARAENLLVSNVQAAAQEDATHAEWLLERRFSERWSRKDQVKVQMEAELQTILDAIQRALPADMYEKALEAIVAAQSGDLPVVPSPAAVLQLAATSDPNPTPAPAQPDPAGDGT